MLSFFKKYNSKKAAGSSKDTAYLAYESSRFIKDRKHLCHAPFNNMYFNIHGQAGPCWLTLNDGDTYPDKSIHDIWFGKRFQDIRNKILKRDLSTYCTTCKMNIDNGNYVSVLAKLYDLPYELTEYPSEMEFELSNQCNLECVMCKGELSSSIRKNREELSPISQPYDRVFVEQLREFVPHLQEAKFLGGEPFLIDIYADIWDLIKELNPGMKITVTTNGTALNNRIKNLIESLDFHIVISIDSFKKETYEKIRIKAVYETVMKHLEYFLDYAKRKGKYLQVSINPLRKNWHELHEYVDFCNEQNMFLWFNTVIYPHEEALWSLSAAELNEIQNFLASRKLKPRPSGTSKDNYANNVRVFRNLVDVQIVKWLDAATEREKVRIGYTPDDSFDQELRKELETYFETDYYLVEGVKERKLRYYSGKLDKLKAAEPVRYHELTSSLYKRPFNDILQLLRSCSPEELTSKLGKVN